jgi:hypothetical protein
MSGKCERPYLEMFRSFTSTKLVTVLIVLLFFSGCRKASGPIDQKQTNLSWLGSMYRNYIGQNQGHPPKTIDDLRKYVEKNTSAEQLARLKVGSMNELFVSPGDGKPFTLVAYDKLPPPKAGSLPPVVLYESQGEGGKRAVGFLGGGTRILDDSELQTLLPANAKLAH